MQKESEYRGSFGLVETFIVSTDCSRLDSLPWGSFVVVCYDNCSVFYDPAAFDKLQRVGSTHDPDIDIESVVKATKPNQRGQISKSCRDLRLACLEMLLLELTSLQFSDPLLLDLIDSVLRLARTKEVNTLISKIFGGLSFRSFLIRQCSQDQFNQSLRDEIRILLLLNSEIRLLSASDEDRELRAILFGLWDSVRILRDRLVTTYQDLLSKKQKEYCEILFSLPNPWEYQSLMNRSAWLQRELLLKYLNEYQPVEYPNAFSSLLQHIFLCSDNQEFLEIVSALAPYFHKAFKKADEFIGYCLSLLRGKFLDRDTFWSFFGAVRESYFSLSRTPKSYLNLVFCCPDEHAINICASYGAELREVVFESLSPNDLKDLIRLSFIDPDIFKIILERNCKLIQQCLTAALREATIPPLNALVFYCHTPEIFSFLPDKILELISNSKKPESVIGDFTSASGISHEISSNFQKIIAWLSLLTQSQLKLITPELKQRLLESLVPGLRLSKLTSSEFLRLLFPVMSSGAAVLEKLIFFLKSSVEGETRWDDKRFQTACELLGKLAQWPILRPDILLLILYAIYSNQHGWFQGKWVLPIQQHINEWHSIDRSPELSRKLLETTLADILSRQDLTGHSIAALRKAIDAYQAVMMEGGEKQSLSSALARCTSPAQQKALRAASSSAAIIRGIDAPRNPFSPTIHMHAPVGPVVGLSHAFLFPEDLEKRTDRSVLHPDLEQFFEL